jgi:hypothetical protein
MPNLIDRTIASFSTSQHWFADRLKTWLAQDLAGLRPADAAVSIQSRD